MRFDDRRQAGERLAEEVARRELDDPLVLALPRGGVPVAFAVARRLDAPLDVLVARKVGAPHQPELGIGAVAEGGGEVVDQRSAQALRVSEATFAALAQEARQEMARRVRRYRGGRPLPATRAREVVVVDDGLATGVTAEAALGSVRASAPARLVLAVPVGAADTVARLGRLADEVVCLSSPASFGAVGHWYRDFAQTTDDEVLRLLEEAGGRGR